MHDYIRNESKMSKIKIFILPLILVGLLSNQANAQFLNCDDDGKNPTTGENCVNTIITAVPFLRIVPGARSGAMGDVGLAISPDANTMHFNASKLAFVENTGSFSATYTPWLRSLQLNDVYLAYASGYYSPDDLQTFGASLRFFSLGRINFTDFNGESLGTGDPSEFEVSVAYARKLSDNFSVGVAPKFIFSNLASDQFIGQIEVVPGIAGAADFSGTYMNDISLGEKSANLTIAASIANIGSKISYTRSTNKDYIPTNLGIGSALEIALDEFNALTFAVDMNKLLVPTRTNAIDGGDPTIEDWREHSTFGGIITSFGDAPGGFGEELRELMFSFGVEYLYDNQFAVRAGYYTESNTKGGRKYFTVGLGLKYSIFGLNFSYLVPTTNQRNPLDNTLRFSLIFDFNGGDVVEE